MDRMTEEEKKMLLENAQMGMAPPPGGMGAMRAFAKALRGVNPSVYNRAKLMAKDLKGLPKQLQRQKVSDLPDGELKSALMKLLD